jgi:hypothetical protein
MLKGHQICTLHVDGYVLVEIPEMQFIPGRWPEVRNVVLRMEDERHFHVTVHFAQVASEQEAKQIAQQVARHAADTIAFETGIAVGDPAFGEGAFLSLCDPMHQLISHSLNMTTAGQAVSRPTSQQVATIKNALEEFDSQRHRHIAEFRWILIQDDPVARFLYFYRMLLSLTRQGHEAQKFVDAFIVSVEPTVVRTPQPAPRKGDETIYSRLRNEAAHDRNAVPEQTKQEIMALESQFASHVKTAVSTLL